MAKNFKSTKNISILQKGLIYFVVRPKVTKEFFIGIKDEVQNFTIILNPHASEKFILLLIGRKELPRGKGRSYFSFVEKIYTNKAELAKNLEEKHYQTKTRGERILHAVHFLGYGKYFLFQNGQHTELLYRLIVCSESENAQLSFNIHEYDQFIIQVKNTTLPSFHSSAQPHLPENLENLFMNRKFIPLIPVDFIFYEGVELLLNSRGKETLITSEPGITEYLYRDSKENLLSCFASEVGTRLHPSVAG